jgi:hypothetical protein
VTPVLIDRRDELDLVGFASCALASVGHSRPIGCYPSQHLAAHNAVVPARRSRDSRDWKVRYWDCSDAS